MAHGRFTKWPSTPLSALPRWYLQGIPNQQVEDGSDFGSCPYKKQNNCNSLPVYEGLILLGKGILSLRAILESLIPTKLQATRHLRLGIGHFRGQGHPATEHLLFEAKCDCSKLQAQQVSAMSLCSGCAVTPELGQYLASILSSVVFGTYSKVNEIN